DGDGDTATSSTGIGDAVQFQDDGPTAAIVQGAPTVAHDETAGVQADADDTTAAGGGALFAGVGHVRSGLSPAGDAQEADTGGGVGREARVAPTRRAGRRRSRWRCLRRGWIPASTRPTAPASSCSRKATWWSAASAVPVARRRLPWRSTAPAGW